MQAIGILKTESREYRMNSNYKSFEEYKLAHYEQHKKILEQTKKDHNKSILYHEDGSEMSVESFLQQLFLFIS
jgi:hypothetical protein